jgi:hypothetical protein
MSCGRIAVSSVLDSFRLKSGLAVIGKTDRVEFNHLQINGLLYVSFQFLSMMMTLLLLFPIDNEQQEVFATLLKLMLLGCLVSTFDQLFKVLVEELIE